jgi:hypothetical protein
MEVLVLLRYVEYAMHWGQAFGWICAAGRRSDSIPNWAVPYRMVEPPQCALVND